MGLSISGMDALVQDLSVMLTKPTKYADAKIIGRKIKQNIICVLNLEALPKEEAKRIDSCARFLKWWGVDVVLMQEMRDAATCSNLVARPALAGISAQPALSARPGCIGAAPHPARLW